MLDLISGSYDRTNRERLIATGRVSTNVVYAAALVALLEYLPAVPSRVPIVTHIVDLGVFCATIRWQSAATFWPGLVAIVGFTIMGIYTAEVLQDPAFELNRFLIRSVYLAVPVALLSYLGAHRRLAAVGARRVVFLWKEGFSSTGDKWLCGRVK
jgi:hypothetical protein